MSRVLSRLRRDDGFTLVEAVLSLVIFALLASITASLLIGILAVTKANDNRSVASSLASQQIEAVRASKAVDIPDGLVTSSSTVNGTTYTVRQNANFVSSGASGSLCTSSSSTLAYKLVTVEVTWPGMRSEKPVRMETLEAVGLGADALDATKATIAVLVRTPAGTLVSDALVTLGNGLSRLTGLDGCAVFTGVAADTSYYPSVSKSGYVNRDGQATWTAGSSGVSAARGEVGRMTVDTYAPSGSLAVTLRSANGFPVPSSLGLTMQSTIWTTSPVRSFPDCTNAPTPPISCVSWGSSADPTVQARPRVATALFPDRYTAWAGTCTPGAPATSATTGLQRVNEGATTPATLQLVDLLVRPPGVTGANRVWLQNTGTGCASEQWALTEDASTPGTYRIALPAGTTTWRVVTTATSAPPTSTAQVVVAPRQFPTASTVGNPVVLP
nr:type II secretion system protein [Motilibacter deserti]